MWKNDIFNMEKALPVGCGRGFVAVLINYEQELSFR